MANPRKEARRAGKNKSTQTVNQTTDSSPWGPAQPYIRDILGQAAEQYHSGTGQSLPPYSAYAGMGAGTQDAIAQLRATASTPSPYAQTGSDIVQGVLNDPRYAELYAQAMAASPGTDTLEALANGTAGNPYLQQLLDTGAGRITDATRASYAAKGRYGSEDFTDALGRNISEYQTPIQYAAYEGDQGRRLQAAGMLDANYLNRLTSGLNIAGADTSARLNAGNLAGMLDQNRYRDTNALLMAGGLEDQDTQNQRDADYARWLWENGLASQEALQQYASLIGGASQGYGTSTTTGTTTVQEPRRPFLTVLGALSGLGGILSDERVKQDVKKVGETEEGLGIYTYRLRGSPNTRMGVLAQEVAEKQPEALGPRRGGMLTVDYRKVA